MMLISKGFGRVINTPFVVLSAIVLWEFMVKLFNIPRFVLPSPSDIIATITRYPLYLISNLLETLYFATLGLCIAALSSMALSLLLAYSETIRGAIYPVIAGFNAIPRAALVPVLVIWFGLGSIPKILTAFLIAFFPILVPSLTAMITIEKEMWELLVSFGATKRQILVKVAIPRAMPYFLSSLQAGFTGALVGTVIAEMVASDRGLGYIILSSTSRLDTPLAFSCLVLLSIVALILSKILTVLERGVVRWAYRVGE
ncbi:MAG: ABC transporter permease [Ignisphaera sp.]|nr:ABC transporter permease [Ignisphaera sp.]MCX8168367.1 ABC transporter permease [Ignisphaera sp.]MDW8086183.1 ABC transporter permease [Ignisphaera sp.]